MMGLGISLVIITIWGLIELAVGFQLPWWGALAMGILGIALIVVDIKMHKAQVIERQETVEGEPAIGGFLGIAPQDQDKAN